jgi:GST-like protein
MIDLYTWTTGNGRKIVIMLEEVGLDYEVHPVNIYKGEQFAPDFLKISPNNKVPAIVDRDGPGGKALSVFESAACLMYLAEKTGQLMPADVAARYDVIQWLVLTVAGLGPAIGQAHYFHGPGKDGNEAAAARFTKETARMFNVLDRRLRESPWIGGAEYSIADISAVGRVAGYKNAGVDINETPALAAWLERVDARPASVRAAKVIADLRAAHATPVDNAARDILYGDTQFARR